MPAYLSKSLFLAGLILSLLGSVPDAFCQVATQKYAPVQIAAIQTDAQLLELIRPFGWEFEEAVLGDSAVVAYRPYRSTRFAVRGAQTWFKADFDHNGLLDLLVLARRKDIPFVFCVLDKGNGKLSVVRNFYKAVDRRFPVARIIQKNGQDLLEYADYARGHGPRGQLQNRQIQVLTYVSGGFVEYNSHPEKHRIQQLTYEGHSVYHESIRTRIIIKQDSIIFWQQKTDIRDSASVTRQENKHILLSAQCQELTDLLNYIGFSRLQDEYEQNPGNHRTHVKMTIEYDNGRRKFIDDHYGNATTGLRRLYVLLHELSRS